MHRTQREIKERLRDLDEEKLALEKELRSFTRLRYLDKWFEYEDELSEGLVDYFLDNVDVDDFQVRIVHSEYDKGIVQAEVTTQWLRKNNISYVVTYLRGNPEGTWYVAGRKKSKLNCPSLSEIEKMRKGNKLIDSIILYLHCKVFNSLDENGESEIFRIKDELFVEDGIWKS